MVAPVSSMSGPGSLPCRCSVTTGESVSSSTSSLQATERSKIPECGVRKRIVTVRRVAAIALPVRSRNGTPRQRSLSTQASSATKVSTSESGSTSSSSR